MEIQLIDNKKEWQDIMLRMRGASFLQSWEWGQVHVAQDKKVYRHVLLKAGRPLAAAQWIEMQLGLGRVYWLAPYGPVLACAPIDEVYTDYIHALLTQSVRSEKSSKPVFVRIEPRIELCNESIFLIARHQERLISVSAVQPADTRIIQLDQPEDVLLESMHQKTRYNIRLAEKKGVRILRDDAYIEDFIRLNHETSSRDGFVSHPDDHYRQIIGSLPKDMRDVYAAEYEGNIVSANIVVTYNKTTTYVHGASSSNYRNIMAPHLLQWRQIRDARARGDSRYDFFGIAPSTHRSEKQSAWGGITRFKNGFAGIEKNYVGTWDLPIQKLLYSLYSVARSLRHKIR